MAHDAETRAVSRTTAPIAPGEHAAWLARGLADDHCQMLIGERDQTPVGQIRFDAQEHERYEIGVGLAPGRGVSGSGRP